MPITTVLFDLDGTLLPMDQDVFTKTYFGLLAKRMTAIGYEPDSLIRAVWKGTGAMLKNNGEMSNEAAFWETFAGLYPDRDIEADKPHFEAFYAHEFQEVSRICTLQPLAATLIRKLRERSYRLILATNPLFPPIATVSRIRWAGLEPEDFVFFTTYENSSYCKPDPRYYQEILDRFSLKPEECLMVGNDVTDDMAAAKLGMQVFLLTDCLINKEERSLTPYHQGSFSALLAYMDQLA
jgi:HAD superfamily hydrolase (TIGR01549 family)